MLLAAAHVALRLSSTNFQSLPRRRVSEQQSIDPDARVLSSLLRGFYRTRLLAPGTMCRPESVRPLFLKSLILRVRGSTVRSLVNCELHHGDGHPLPPRYFPVRAVISGPLREQEHLEELRILPLLLARQNLNVFSLHPLQDLGPNQVEEEDQVYGDHYDHWALVEAEEHVGSVAHG